MKCPYDDFECDWLIETGDIECRECEHYIGRNSVPIFDWMKELLNKIFSKK